MTTTKRSRFLLVLLVFALLAAAWGDDSGDVTTAELLEENHGMG